MAMEGYTDISIKLSTTFMKAIGLWIADNAIEKRRRKIALRYTICLVITATIIEVRDLYYSWGDKGNFLYVGCNVLSLIMVMFKVFGIMARKVEFVELILYMQDKFWNVNYNHYEKQILADSRKVCIMFIFFVTITGHCAIVGYLVTPIIANIGKNESERVLLFNMWLDLPLSLTPYYEMAFFMQFMTLYHVGVCYFCFDNFMCVLCVHTAGQFRILQYRLTELCDQEEMKDHNVNTDLANYATKSYAKLKECIKQHQNLIAYCAKLEHVFAPIILGQVLVSSILICLLGYQIFMANASFTRRCIFISSTPGSLFLLLMFTYSCNGLIVESDNIGGAAFAASWTHMPMTKYGRMFRNDVMFTMLRSKKVCCLTANGFFPVSLETYTKILSTAVSYYTLLCEM